MVSIKELCFGYSSKSILYRDLNLELKPGHIYGLLGKNGAGKTSLLKNMVGLVYAQNGLVEFKGINVKNRSVDVLSDLYFIPEDPYFPPVNPLKFAKYHSPFYPKFSLDRFNKNLVSLEVDPNRTISDQSFGQQKKTIIAFALATGVSLTLMDEPTNGLDIPSKSQFRKLMASTLDEEKALIISTHQVRDLESLIDTLIILDKKEIKVNASLDDISKKLSFSRNPKGLEMEGIYSEDSVYGKTEIVPNKDSDSGKVDLELLFNAVINENELVINSLKSN